MVALRTLAQAAIAQGSTVQIRRNVFTLGPPDVVDLVPLTAGRPTASWVATDLGYQAGLSWLSTLAEPEPNPADLYHPLIEGLDNPDGNYGWGEEGAPGCAWCGRYTPEGTQAPRYGWLCDRCWGLLFD